METSNDSTTWEEDAAYTYYKHGPLSNMILGDENVQSLNYAYTLQGWLKGVNSSAPWKWDMGKDGFTGLSYARDAFGFALNYYNGDYDPINKLSTSKPFASMSGVPGFKSLYNGNIASMSVYLPKLGTPLLYSYSYDQLNRLTGMQTATGLDTTLNTWTAIQVNNFKEKIKYDANGNITNYSRYANAGTIMDSLGYVYNPNTNKLNQITDKVGSAAFPDDIDSQMPDNYLYDSIGNLTKDVKNGIGTITWNVYGKITSVSKTGGSINYTYDASGNRISKEVVSSGNPTVTTWYVRDATGNVMSVYTRGDNTQNAGALTQSEIDLYGSSRLGLYRPTLNVENPVPLPQLALTGVGTGYFMKFDRGRKSYELTNHLGNVLATISDKRIGVDANSNGYVDYFMADVVSESDYYPFGMLMPSRSFTAQNSSYRYGFNGKERDPNIISEDYDYGSRMYDARVGRFLSIDSKSYDFPWQSTYAYGANNPIKLIDFDGEGPEDPLDKTLEARLKIKLSATNFVSVIRKSNNFSLRALEKWGWIGNPTNQQENKVSGLAGEATVASDLASIPLFTQIKSGNSNSWAPELAPASSSLIRINASGDADDDRTIDILMNVQAGNFDGAKFGITLPFVNLKGQVNNQKNGGTSYDQTTTNFVIEVKTGNSAQNFAKGFNQAIRQTGKLNERSPNTLNVPVLALDRDAYLQAIKDPVFLRRANEFLSAGGQILNIKSLNERSSSLKEAVREEVRNGQYLDKQTPDK